ncbi:RNA polymerase sigma factor [Pendulispora rubella]|uniref:RNA polymerase sigma factor n=1 Tax=Pendulispora rubella TaxID=2741070 RepID=A0ABZ2KSS8_9BACT
MTTSDTFSGITSELIALAVDGDRHAIEKIVRTLQKPIHGVALRMLLHRVDAEDATQEALIRIITRLAQYRGEAKFSTWAWRIAVRRILDFREERAAAAQRSFDAFANDLAEGRDDQAVPRPEDELLHRQLKVACSRAMLQCLDGDHRIAFILGEILGFSSDEAAEVLEIEAAAFRKRLSRARTALVEFLSRTCGVFEPKAPCACHRRIDRAINLGRVKRNDLEVREEDGNVPALQAHLSTLSEMHRLTAYYRSDPDPKSKRDFVVTLRTMIHQYKEPPS